MGGRYTVVSYKPNLFTPNGLLFLSGVSTLQTVIVEDVPLCMLDSPRLKMAITEILPDLHWIFTVNIGRRLEFICT